MAERMTGETGDTNHTGGNTDGSADGGAAARKAGAFDIRNFIGMLIGVFGLVLLLATIFDGEAELAKTDGVRINLWAGLGMVVTAAVFFVWARLRPVVVPADTTPGSSTSH